MEQGETFQGTCKDRATNRVRWGAKLYVSLQIWMCILYV